MAASSFSPARIVRLSLLSAGALAMLAPYVWMVSVAGKSRAEIFSYDCPAATNNRGATATFTSLL